MRIISGKARGTNLFTLKGNDITRPTLDRVKESIFNIIQNKIQDSIFLDLFSGSGAIGLEAASRGAKLAILCDKDKNAIQVIEKNIEKTHMQKQTELYMCDYELLIKNKIDNKLDIVYIDPPYKSNYAINAIKLLLEKDLLKKDSIVILETDRLEDIEKELNSIDIDIIDKRKYGRAEIIFLQPKNHLGEKDSIKPN